MKLLWMAALAALAPALASAATIIEPTVPPGISDSPPGAAPPAASTAAPEPPPPPRPPQNEMRAQHDADARQCLTLPTNRQVHACAERYRAHAARARTARAGKAPASGEMVKAAETSKVEGKPAAAPPSGTFVIRPPEQAKPVAEAPKPAAQPPKTADVIKPEPPNAPAPTPPTQKPTEPAKK